MLLYGTFKGVREIFKKMAMEKNTVLEVLVSYTVFSCVLVVLSSGAEIALEASSVTEYMSGLREYLFGLRAEQYLAIALKSFVIFVAWICGFYALKKMPVSVYGILDMARVIFAALLGILVLRETPTGTQGAGILLVCTGLFLLRFIKEPAEEPGNSAEQAAAGTVAKPEVTKQAAAGAGAKPEVTEQAVAGVGAKPEVTEQAVAGAGAKPEVTKQAAAGTGKAGRIRQSTAFCIILSMISCFLNAVSGTMDKILMKSNSMKSGQLQLWYMIFLVLFYLLFIGIRKIRLNRKVWRNPWVIGLSILFVIADRLLFVANGDPNSKVLVMTVLKQACSIVTILGGWLVFKEKKIAQKLVCAGIVICGIVISVL